ncbi:MAG: S1-like domain-containing RNA-binding protein [Tannerellaceae bacterium]
MVEIGKYNTLKIVKDLDFGVYLDGGDELEILLPARYVPKNVKPGDELEVFIYHDNEGRIIATTARPLATVGEFQFMEVKSVSNAGAFLEWGLMKDLLVPFREQKMPMREGRWYLVYVYLDHVSERIVASARIDKHLDNVPPEYTVNQEVNLLVADETEIGYKVIINNLHWGLLYHNEVFTRLEKGEHIKGYIKEVREDGKIDVSLTPLGYQKVEGIAGVVLESLRAQGGYIAVHDKSEPELIYSLFRCSKKAFKQAIGALYKQKLILLEADGIRLAGNPDQDAE